MAGDGHSTALLVSGDASARAALRASLAVAGYRIVEVDSLAAALAKMAAEPFDLLVLDPRLGELVDILVHDIRSRREAEEVSQAVGAEAEHVIQRHTQLLASVSHDLKNALGLIKGNVQILMKRIARSGTGDPTGQIAPALARIDVCTTKMARELDALLDLSRLQASGSLPLDSGPTDLIALTRELVEEYRQTTQHHQIHHDAVTPDLVGCWDRARLERALGNLLANAIKYSPHGGEITVTVRRESDVAGEWAILTVADRGIGIPAADLPHLFEGFYRGSNVRGRISGTGVGLFDVRQIVEQHGGTITVESHEGQGTTFTIRLPLSQPDTASTGGECGPRFLTDRRPDSYDNQTTGGLS